MFHYLTQTQHTLTLLTLHIVSNSFSSLSHHWFNFQGIGAEEYTHSFTGDQWLEYSVVARPLISYYDELTLSFKTNRQTGLLFHAGQTSDFMSLALVDGKVMFSILLKESEFTVDFEPRAPTTSYADNNWHDVKIVRDVFKVRGSFKLKTRLETIQSTLCIERIWNWLTSSRLKWANQWINNADWCDCVELVHQWRSPCFR